MADYLTERLKKDLENRGIIVSDDEASELISRHDMRGPLAPQLEPTKRRTQERLITPGAALLPRRGDPKEVKLYDIAESDVPRLGIFAGPDTGLSYLSSRKEDEGPGFAASAWDFVGEAVWAFADTASFGVAGWADTKLGLGIEEAFTGIESDWGKWGSALGGIAGFITPYGLPMKLGRKATQLAAKQFIKYGRKAPVLSTVKKEMIAKGMKGGTLSGKQAKWVAGQYENIVSQGVIKENFVVNFATKSNDLWQTILTRGILGKQLTKAEGKAVSRMFEGNIKVRPMQDFVDLFKTSARFKGSQKTAYVLGSMVNEAVMFGAIDAVFEVFHSSKDERGYDWTAPIWGMGVGAGFGALKWFSPRGKHASMKRDFTDGIKGAFAKDTFAGQGTKQIRERALSLGNLIRDTKGDRWGINEAKPWIIKNIPYIGGNKTLKGKTFDLNIGSAHDVDNFRHLVKSQKSADAMMKFALQTTTRQYGKKLARWSMSEEWGSIKANWGRMVAGAIIMNARTFVDAYRYDMDLNVHDVLPHLLIGAWVNRHGNPVAWDLNVKGHVDNLRAGLNILGVPARNLNEIPSFNPGIPDFINPVTQDAKQRGWLDAVKEYKIISDNFADTVTDRLKRNSKGDIIERSAHTSGEPDIDIYHLLRQYFHGVNITPGSTTKHRGTDRIPEREALDVVKQFKEANPEVKNLRDAEKFLEKQAGRSTDVIEEGMHNVIKKLSKVEEMEFNSDADSPLPNVVFGADLRTKFKAENRVEELTDLAQKVDNIFKLMMSEEGIARFPERSGKEGEPRIVNSETSYNKIKEVVEAFELSINENANTTSFNMKDSYADIAYPMISNNYRKTIKAIDEQLFDWDAPKHGEFANVLRRLELLQGKVEREERYVSSVENIDWTGVKEGDAGSEAQRAKEIVGSVLSILSAKGQYKPLPPDVRVEMNVKEVIGDGKFSLAGVLKSMGFRTDAGILKRFQGDIIDYLTTRAIRDSSLLTSHVDFLYNLSETEGDWGGFKADVRGGDSGWYVWKIKEIEGMPWLEDAKVYNRWVDEVIEAGEGRVAEGSLIHYAGEKIPVDFKDVTALIQAKNLVGAVAHDAKIELMNFMSVMQPKHGPIRHRIEHFVLSRDNRDPIRMLKWLENLGIMKATEQPGKLKYEPVYEALVDKKLLEKLNKKLDDHGGLTRQTAEALHDMEGDRVRDLTDDLRTYQTNKRLTLSEFYNKYGFTDHPGIDYKEQKLHMDRMLFDNITGDPRPDAVRRIMKNMLYDVADKRVELKDIKNKELKSKLRNISKQEVLSAVLTRLGRSDKIAFSFINGNITESIVSGQKDPFSFVLDNWGIQHFPLVGEASGFDMSEYSQRITRRYYNMFEADAEAGRSLHPDIVARLKNQENNFVNELGKYSELTEGDAAGFNIKVPGGFVVFKVSKKIQPFAIRTESLPQLAKAYNDLMKKYAPLQVADKLGIEAKRWDMMLELQRKINGLDRKLKKGDSIQWEVDGEGKFSAPGVVESIARDGQSIRVVGVDETIPISEVYFFEGRKAVSDGREMGSANVYGDAMNRVLGEIITTGLGDHGEFVKLMNGDNAHTEKIFNRFNLLSTRNFRRERADVVVDMPKTSTEARVFDKYQKLGKFRTTIWDDESNAAVRNYVQDQYKEFGMKWDSVINNPGEKSAYDSIAYLSRDAMTYQALMHGFDSPAKHNLLKPVISSYGKDILLFGKTLFVWDPYLEKTYFKNNNVDMLMTKSAAKIVDSVWGETKSRGGGLIDASVEDIHKFVVTDNVHVRGIPLTAIGVMPNNYNEGIAKHSETLHTFMNHAENDLAFNGLYSAELDYTLQSMKTIASNPIASARFLAESAYEKNFGMESVMAGEGTSTYEQATTVSAYYEYNRINPLADPTFYTRGMLKNRLLQKFMAPIFDKKAVFNGNQYGGKSVLIQSLDPKFRNLKATLVDSDGTMKQYGELVLPSQARDWEVSDLVGAGFELRFIDRSVKDVSKQIKSADEVFGKELFIDMMKEGFNLESIHELLEGSKIQIGILSNRYPRTRPNDVMVLGLHSFLAREYGNSMIVNSMDVFNIFEGDYDVDKNDYFFAQRPEYFNHALKTMETNFVQGINPDDLKASVGINFGLNPTDAHSKWSEYIAGGSALKKAIGIGQKLSRKLNHLTQLLPQDENGHYVIRQYMQDGKNVKIVMDYNNKDMFQRLALETQAVIDAGSKVDYNLFERISEWSDKFLFPSMTESVDSKVFGKMGFIQDQKSNPKEIATGQRVRVFKKLVEVEARSGVYEETQAHIISPLEKAMIKAILDNYGQFLQLGTKIFDPTGESRFAGYDDVMDRSKKYFKFFGGTTGDIGTGVYNVIKRNRELLSDKGIRDQINEVFGVQRRVKPHVGRKKYSFDRSTGEYKVNEGYKYNTWDFYYTNTKSPWDSQYAYGDVIRENAGQIFKGQRGSVTDRIFNRLQREDPAGERDRQIGPLTGSAVLEMDNALARFISGREYVFGKKPEISYELSIDEKSGDRFYRQVEMDEYIRDVVRTVRSLQSNIFGIKKLLRQFGFVSRSKMSRAAKDKAIKGINIAKGILEGNITEYIRGTPYAKTRKAKDLPAPEYVNLDSDFELRHATTQLWTLRSLFGTDLSEVRNPQMDKHIRLIRNVERIYWGDNQNLSQTIKYGDTSLLTAEMKKYLAARPDEITFTKMINDMLNEAYIRWGPVSLYKYAMPKENYAAVGILGSTPVPVPWMGKFGLAPKRYQRMIKFMAKESMKGDGGMEDSLRQILAAQTWFGNLINRRINWLPGEDALAAADPNHWFGAVGSNSLRIPDFAKPFADTYDRMSSIEWSVGTKGRFDPFQLWDDHLIQFYRDLYKLSGREADFNDYIESVSSIRAIMASNDMIEPFHYLAVLENVEKNIHKFVTEAISSGLSKEFETSGNSVAAKDLRQNRVFVLLGGEKHFSKLKDISLSPIMRMDKYQIKQISNFIRMGKDIKTQSLRRSPMENEVERTMKGCFGK